MSVEAELEKECREEWHENRYQHWLKYDFDNCVESPRFPSPPRFWISKKVEEKKAEIEEHGQTKFRIEEERDRVYNEERQRRWKMMKMHQSSSSATSSSSLSSSKSASNNNNKKGFLNSIIDKFSGSKQSSSIGKVIEKDMNNISKGKTLDNISEPKDHTTSKKSAAEQDTTIGVHANKDNQLCSDARRGGRRKSKRVSFHQGDQDDGDGSSKIVENEQHEGGGAKRAQLETFAPTRKFLSAPNTFPTLKESITSAPRSPLLTSAPGHRRHVLEQSSSTSSSSLSSTIGNTTTCGVEQASELHENERCAQNTRKKNIFTKIKDVLPSSSSKSSSLLFKENIQKKLEEVEAQANLCQEQTSSSSQLLAEKMKYLINRD